MGEVVERVHDPLSGCIARGAGRNTVKRRASRRVIVLAPLLVLACMVLFWWAITAWSGIQAWRLPSPHVVLARGYSLIQQPQLWLAFLRTGGEALVGGFVGVCIALPLSYCIFRFQIFSDAIEPLLGASQALPAVALAPFLVLWFGYGLIPISMLCALIAFFPILISSLVGLRSLDRQVCEAAQLDGASGATMALRIELPLAAPAILAGIRNGFTLSITGAVVGEMVMGGQGLGMLLSQMRTNVDTAGMFVVIILLCLQAVLIYLLMSAWESRARSSVATD